MNYQHVQRGNVSKMRKLRNNSDPAELVPRLLEFPPSGKPTKPSNLVRYDGQIRAILRLLEETSPEVLAQTSEDGSTLLDVLDPAVHSLQYSYVLNAVCQSVRARSATHGPLLEPDSGGLWQLLVGFLSSFDPIQMRYAGPQYLSAVEQIYLSAREAGQPHLGIAPIRTAMLRLDPSTETFTSVHHQFAHLCLLTKSYGEALPILDNDIYHFPVAPSPALRSKLPPPCANHEFSSGYITMMSGHSRKLTHRITLEYYMYSAMIYMCLKNWERALFFLEACLTMPTQNVASMIQVEAYRKYLLVGLIHKGEDLPMPKNINTQAIRIMRNLSRAYEGVAEIFKTGPQDRLRQEIEIGAQIWQHDNNYSLLLQVFFAFRKFALIRLSSTYTALSIPTIMTLIPPSPIHGSNPTETEAYIADLIASGAFSGVLIPGPTPSDPATLRFTSPTADADGLDYEGRVEKMLAEKTEEIRKLGAHMRAVGETLQMSKEYVEWLKKMRRGEAERSARVANIAATESIMLGKNMPGPFDDDEDVMADL